MSTFPPPPAPAHPALGTPGRVGAPGRVSPVVPVPGPSALRSRPTPAPIPQLPSPSAHEHNAYDALTDLFLGDGPLAPARPAERRPNAQPPIISETMPRLLAATDHVRNPAGASARHDPEPRAALASRPQIEGLVLGHLPVSATAWAGQYARHLAAERGVPVAVLRLSAGQASVELVGVAPGAEFGPAPVAATLDEAIRAVGAITRFWLVRSDETIEPRLAELDRLDAVTLLTGTDEAAIVASYRTLKVLMHDRRDADGDPIGPGVKVAIMGAQPEKAVEIGRKLQRAAETFLGRGVGVAACVQRIEGGVSTTSLFRGPTGAPLEEVLDAIDAAVQTVPRPVGLGPRLSRAGAMTPDLIATNLESVALPHEIRGGHSAPPMPLGARSPAHGRPATNAGIPMVRPPRSLAGLVTGLRALPARCPYAGEVELAVAHDGTAHLFVRDGSRGIAAATGAEPDGVGLLLAAAAWSVAHATLIGLASPGEPAIDPDRRPVLHLMTDRPARARRLLDADLRIHLLAPVEVEGRHGWFCTDLN